MSFLEKWQRAGDRVDGYVGRIVYRFFGVIAAIIGLAAAWAGWDLLSTGKSILAGLAFAIPAFLCLWLAKWCFSPQRKLSEIEF